MTTWANDFWTVTNGIPYPTNLGVREGEIPQVSIPTVVAPGSEVVIAGATMYDRVILAADAKELGITVSNNVILVPDTVPTGTTINLAVQSVFDETKKVNLSAEVLTSKNVNMEEVIYEGEGLLARAFCHEIDHLDGHLYVEKVEGEIHDVTYEDEEIDEE